MNLRCRSFVVVVFAVALSSSPLLAQKKNAKKPEPAKPVAEEEKKGGLTADTFSGLQFRSIGPAVASGRAIGFAVNPKNHAEYYVGVASGGVWKTVNALSANPPSPNWTRLLDIGPNMAISSLTLDPT